VISSCEVILRVGYTKYNLKDLCNRILEEVALIDRNMIRNAVSNFYERIAHCQIVNDVQFEHFM